MTITDNDLTGAGIAAIMPQLPMDPNLYALLAISADPVMSVVAVPLVGVALSMPLLVADEIKPTAMPNQPYLFL